MREDKLRPAMNNLCSNRSRAKSSAALLVLSMNNLCSNGLVPKAARLACGFNEQPVPNGPLAKCSGAFLVPAKKQPVFQLATCQEQRGHACACHEQSKFQPATCQEQRDLASASNEQPVSQLATCQEQRDLQTASCLHQILTLAAELAPAPIGPCPQVPSDARPDWAPPRRRPAVPRS